MFHSPLFPLLGAEASNWQEQMGFVWLNKKSKKETLVEKLPAFVGHTGWKRRETALHLTPSKGKRQRSLSRASFSQRETWSSHAPFPFLWQKKDTDFNTCSPPPPKILRAICHKVVGRLKAAPWERNRVRGIIPTWKRGCSHFLKGRHFVWGNHGPLERWGCRGNMEEAA